MSPRRSPGRTAIVSDRLRDAVAAGATPAWPWPETQVTYETALVPRALIVSGSAHGKPDTVALGLTVLDWLIDHATAPDGLLMPVGNGWWPSGGERSRFDQQPIEATSMLLAAGAALEATNDERYRAAMERCYAWFLGGNDAGRGGRRPCARREPRRPDAHRPEPQPGCRVDAHVAHGAGAHPRAPGARIHVDRRVAVADPGDPARRPGCVADDPGLPRATRDGDLRTGAGR